MRTDLLALLVFGSLIGLLAGCQHQNPEQPMAADNPGRRVSGPFVHKNLAVYLIHGSDTIKGDNYLTLGEAMEQKKLIVYETDNVNELAIENVSDQPVFIQSGDIVKGGKQDRTMGSDLIASAHSGRIPIAAFCVEAGRWQQRAGESQSLFGGSDAMVVGNDMKLAGNSNTSGADQGRVWESVARSQGFLSISAGTTVNSTTSPSSYQLALENEQVQKSTDEYVATLTQAPKGKNDVIGYAVVVNGKISNADVYGSHALFMKVWPRLLKSSAVEALAGLSSNPGQPRNVSSEAIRQFLADAENAKAQRKQLNDRTEAVTYDSAGSVMVQTEDKKTGSASVRRSYISKSGDK